MMDENFHRREVLASIFQAAMLELNALGLDCSNKELEVASAIAQCLREYKTTLIQPRNKPR